MLAGCGSNASDPNSILESHPVRLDGEQVILDSGQLECGAREDLWIVGPMSDGRAVARLTQKGRDLRFSDDVQVGEPGVLVPYVQIHGSFAVKVLQMGPIRDEDAFTKLIDAKVGVKIDHSCFQTILPVLMGIRHGHFDQSTNPVFRYRLDGEWLMDQVIH
jgi:hypothetical protein